MGLFGGTMRKVRHEFSCKACYFMLGEEHTWTDEEIESKCPICGCDCVGKKMLIIQEDKDESTKRS